MPAEGANVIKAQSAVQARGAVLVGAGQSARAARIFQRMVSV
jgi:hypothetical protein